MTSESMMYYKKGKRKNRKRIKPFINVRDFESLVSTGRIVWYVVPKFPYPVDLFQVSIWDRAHRKLLERLGR